MAQVKDLLGYDGRYVIADDGTITGWKGALKPQRINSGYLTVHLYYEGTRQVRTVHRLVAVHFVDGWFEGAHVNHKDGDRTNNRADNLEWVTRSENMQHAYDNGRCNPRHFPVVGTALADGAEIRFVSQLAAEIALSGRGSSAVHHCLIGKKKSAYGYTWRRA